MSNPVCDISRDYRAFAAQHGWTPGPEHCHVLRHVYVAETNARAREEAEPHLDYFWQKLLSYHRGSMKLLGQTPQSPGRGRKASLRWKPRLMDVLSSL